MAVGYGPLERRIGLAALSDRDVPVTLATVTGSRDVPQAVAALLSFRTWVGRPSRIVIADDGTLTHRDRQNLVLLGDNVIFYRPASVDQDLPAAVSLRQYAATSPLGMKLAMLISLTRHGDLPVLYVDSDVLFLRSSDHLLRLLEERPIIPRYMSDPNKGAFDSRLAVAGLDPVNSGFLILPAGTAWEETLYKCSDALANPEWYTEQTVVLFAMHSNNAEPLPPDQYVLRWDDRGLGRDAGADPGVIARHYVSPVRWRFWIRAYGGYGSAVYGAMRGSLPPPIGARDRRKVLGASRATEA